MKPYQGHPNAICFGDAKQAALYFDCVLPMNYPTIRSNEDDSLTINLPDGITSEILSALLGAGAEEWAAQFPRFIDDWVMPFLITRFNGIPHGLLHTRLKQLYLENYTVPGLGSIRRQFANLAHRLGFDYAAIVLPTEEFHSASFEQAYLTVTFNGIPLVDTSRASWRQILEVRRNDAAMDSLRRLRLFVYENYTGKPRSFIEDDLAQRLDDYQRTREALGFRSMTSLLSVVLDSRSMQAAAATGFLTGLLGGPLAGIGAGVSVEVGKVAIEIARRQHAIAELDHGHELGFLAIAREHLS